MPTEQIAVRWHFKACPQGYCTGGVSAHSHVHTVQTQCNIPLLATSAAFLFAGLQCLCLTAWCRHPHTQPGTGVLLQFPRKRIALMPPCLPGSSTEASFKLTPQSPERRLKSGERKNPNKLRGLGASPHKTVSGTDEQRRSEHCLVPPLTHTLCAG